MLEDSYRYYNMPKEIKCCKCNIKKEDYIFYFDGYKSDYICLKCDKKEKNNGK